MYVCMYVCMYVYKYVYVYVCIYACFCLSVGLSVCLSVYIYMPTDTNAVSPSACCDNKDAPAAWGDSAGEAMRRSESSAAREVSG
jgi:hypothetical protein